ncbi:MAG: DNA-binding protein WhiA [Firmicutes bacterium]|nr:DNA-binding protein WhiA [Bacillota bacterium]
MSFINEVKSELAGAESEKDCCALSELSAILRSAGSIVLRRAEAETADTGVGAEIAGESPYACDKAEKIIGRYFGGTCKRTVKNRGGRMVYTAALPECEAGRILAECGILGRGDYGLLTLQTGIDGYVVMEPCCGAAYVRGALLAAGYISVPGDESVTPAAPAASGYQMEFVLSDEAHASAVCRLLARAGIPSKTTERAGRSVVYLKSAQAISDALAFAGAPSAVCRLNGIIATRDMRNALVRQSNCIRANIDKSVAAAVGQAERIKAYLSVNPPESLPLRLREAAFLRAENPELSIAELAGAADFPITKSGLVHRLRKLDEIITDDKCRMTNIDY